MEGSGKGNSGSKLDEEERGRQGRCGQCEKRIEVNGGTNE